MKAFPEIEKVFADFYNNPFQVLNENDQKLRTIEIFVILMYSRNANETDVNLLREEMYFHRTQNIETIPPTKNSLFLHVLHSLYQSGIWSCYIQNMQNLPSPREFGWKESNGTDIK